MKVKKHPDYEKELKRLNETKEHIEHTITSVETYRKMFSDNIKDAMSNLDTQESSSNYIDALINTQFIEIADKNYDNLLRARKKPYFARIDFKQKDKALREQFYIGKTSLLRDGEFTPLVVDWRAPIATLYYEGRLGENQYESEGDIYEGELFLKRQIAIEDGKLEDFIDVDITTNDAFLQASLEASADQRLKDIASTIQAEQNRVIRANMRRPLIVQGVAGSGKTTIALHRIAYFIYTYEKTFNPESFMIIAPNRLFINYISEVLPELGVEKVKQTTYIDFMNELIGKKINLIDKNEKLIKLLHEGQEHNKLLLWNTKFKGSLEYMQVIENYLADIEKKYTPNQHFIYQDEIIASRVEIRTLFLDSFRYMPLIKRVHEIKKFITFRLKQVHKEKLTKTEEQYNLKIDHILRVKEPGDERRTQVVSLMDERDQKLVDLKHEFKHAVKNYMLLFPKQNYMDHFIKLMTDMDTFQKYFGSILSLEQINYHVNLSQFLLRIGKFELEDLSALLYFKNRLHGFDDTLEITTLVIDEAQDFSMFQFYILKHVLKTVRLTLLGDLSQGIHSYRGTTDWEAVMNQVFPDDQPNYMTLVQSYRTTVEIMDTANTVLRKLNDESIVYAKPVIRHGEMPLIREFDNVELLLKSVYKKVDDLHGKGYKSIAIICKTKAECIKLKRAFDHQKKHLVKILDEKEEHYSAGIILVPSYFAKGLEFDAVLILAITEGYSLHPLDIKLLYVAMTRALHHMDLLYVKNTMPILENDSTLT